MNNPDNTPDLEADPFSMPLDEFTNSGDSSSLQQEIDNSLTRDLAGLGRVIAGVRLGPLSLAVIALLHQVGNEIIKGKKVGDMDNSFIAAAQFLMACKHDADLDRLTDLAFEGGNAYTREAMRFAAKIQPCDGLVISIIDFINHSMETRVEAELPASLKGKGDEVGNDSRRPNP